MKTSVRLVALVSCYGLVTGGCRPPIDTDRNGEDSSSFGSTVMELMCKRVSYLEDLADGGKTDVSGATYHDICQLGLAPPDSAPDTLKALMARHDQLVTATDTVFPQPFLAQLQAYLTSNAFLAGYDDGTAIASVDALVGILKLVANDGDAVAALERLDVRPGYRPLEPGLGAIHAAINYPQLQDLVLALVQAVTPGGSARGEWQHLISALGITLRNTEIADAPADPERTANLAVGLLLGQSPLLGTSKTIPLAVRDARGVAVPTTIAAPFVDMDNDGQADIDSLGRFVDASGQPLAVPAPFQRPEGTDPLGWQYYDTDGRALDSNGGAPVYQTMDVDKTVLAALARDGVQLFDPTKGTALDLMRGASALLGGREMATRTYDNGESIDYRGYNLDQAALLDMLFGYLQVLRDPQIDDVLALARTLLVDHQPEVARLGEAIIGAARTGDNHPEATVAAGAPVWDDLMPIVRQVLANPNLVTALLKALESPEVKELGPRFHDYMTYKDRFDIDPNTQAVVGSFATPVDRGQTDNAFNRSLMQRLSHLIAESNHAVACNKQDATIVQFGITVATYNQCEMFQVDNLATFYLDSIAYAKNGNGTYVCEDNGGDFDATKSSATPEGCAGFGSGWRPRPKADFNYNWNKGLLSAGLVGTLGGDGYVEGQAGIVGMRTHPTPEALNRVLFLDPMPAFLQNIIDPMTDRDGNEYRTKHVGTLPVWEKDNFYAEIRPIIQAFADNGAEQLFVDFMAALDKHWPTANSVDTQTTDPSAPDYVFGSGLNSYEPLIADILSQRSLLDTLVDIAPTVDAVTANGKSYATIVRQAGAYLVNPQAGLADRHGNTTSTTSDGRPVAQLSPWQILADAYVLKHQRQDASGAEGQAWTDSVANVVDVLLRGDDVPTVGWQFRNPRMRGVSVALIDFLRTRIAHHDQAGDRTAWLSTTLPQDLQDMLTGPLFAGIADFILSLQAAPDTRTQLEQLMQYLVDEVGNDQTFRTSVTSAADLMQLSVADADIAPLARVAGQALADDKTVTDGTGASETWLDAQLAFVRKAREADTDGTLQTILVDLFNETHPGRSAIGDIIDGIGEVDRANPYQELGQRYTAADYTAMLSGLAAFLDEQKRGLRKFIGIIQDRNL